jgi:hypothetical protein
MNENTAYIAFTAHNMAYPLQIEVLHLCFKGFQFFFIAWHGPPPPLPTVRDFDPGAPLLNISFLPFDALPLRNSNIFLHCYIYFLRF